MKKEIKIALAGNPNSGKTTLFNALTGSAQFVGNWPGVTVEKKEGKLKKHDGVVSIDIGTGMVTVALASLLIGQVLMGRGSILKRAIGMVVGAFAFRLVYTIALRLNMPAFMLKLVSSVIVILAIATPYLKRQMPVLRRRLAARKGGR